MSAEHDAGCTTDHAIGTVSLCTLMAMVDLLEAKGRHHDAETLRIVIFACEGGLPR